MSSKRQQEPESSGRSRSTTNGFPEDFSEGTSSSSRHRSRQRSSHHRSRKHHRSSFSSHLPNGGSPSPRINHRPSSPVAQSSRSNHASPLRSPNKRSASPSSRSPKSSKQARANQDDRSPEKPKEPKESLRPKMGGGFVHQKLEIEKIVNQTVTLPQKRYREKHGLNEDITTKYLPHDQLRAKIENEMPMLYKILHEEKLMKNIFNAIQRRDRFSSWTSAFERDWYKDTEMCRNRTSSSTEEGEKLFVLYNSQAINLNSVQHISNNLTRETSPRPTMADMPEVQCCEPRIVTKAQFDLCCTETAFLSFRPSDKNSSVPTFKPTTPLKYESLLEMPTRSSDSTSSKGKKRKSGKAKAKSRHRTNHVQMETSQDQKDEPKKLKVEECISKLQWLLGSISDESEEKFKMLRSCISQQVDPDQVIHRLRTEAKPDESRLNSGSRKRARESSDSPNKRARRNGEHPTKDNPVNGLASLFEDFYMFVGKRVKTGYQKDFMREALGLKGQTLDLLQWFEADLKSRRNLLLELISIFDKVFNCDLLTPPTSPQPLVRVRRARKGRRGRKSTTSSSTTSQEGLDEGGAFRYCDEYNGWTRFPLNSSPSPFVSQQSYHQGEAKLKRAKEILNEMTEDHRKFVNHFEEQECEGSPLKRSSMTLRSRSNSGTGADDLIVPPLPTSATFCLFTDNEDLEELTEAERKEFNSKQPEISSPKKLSRKNSISMFADFADIESEEESFSQSDFSPRTRARSRCKPGKMETDSKCDEQDPRNSPFGPVIEHVISELRPLAFRNKLRLQHLLDLTELDQSLHSNEQEVLEAEFKLWDERHQYRCLKQKECEISEEGVSHFHQALDDLVVKSRRSSELSTELINNSSVYSNFISHHLSREIVRSVWHLLPMRQPELRRWLDYLLYQGRVANREELLATVPPALPSSSSTPTSSVQDQASTSSSVN